MRARNVLSSNLRTGFRAITCTEPDQIDDDGKKDRTPIGVLSFLEAPPRFGLGIEVLQTFALPLGHGAIFD